MGLILLLLTASSPATAAPYNITDDNRDLRFPNMTLTGDDLLVNATQCPMMSINVNVSTGWNVTLQCSNFTRAGSGTIPASNLSYTATGGIVTRTQGQAIDPINGPRETGYTGTLEAPLKGLTCQPNFGNGKYDWQPGAAGFTLLVTADSYAGSYRATLTMTITAGP